MYTLLLYKRAKKKETLLKAKQINYTTDLLKDNENRQQA